MVVCDGCDSLAGIRFAMSRICLEPRLSEGQVASVHGIDRTGLQKATDLVKSLPTFRQLLRLLEVGAVKVEDDPLLGQRLASVVVGHARQLAHEALVPSFGLLVAADEPARASSQEAFEGRVQLE